MQTNNTQKIGREYCSDHLDLLISAGTVEAGTRNTYVCMYVCMYVRSRMYLGSIEVDYIFGWSLPLSRSLTLLNGIIEEDHNLQ